MARPPGALLAARLFETPLLVDATKAAVIARAFGPRILGVESVDLPSNASAGHEAALRPAMSFIGDEVYQDLVGSGGAYTRVGGAAVIPVTGTMVRRGAWTGENSGMTSYEGLSAMLRAAAQDPQVSVIALEIDSFGGEAAGIFDLCALIQQVRAVKPVHAFVADYALSAGYAIASQANTITLPEFGKVGSVGVVTMHVDYSGQLAQEGVKVTLIQSGAHKTEGNPFEPLADGVRSRLQQESDAMWLAFANAVADGRAGKLDAKAVLATQAGVFMGAEAVASRFADAVAEPRLAFAALVAGIAAEPIAPPPPSGPGAQTVHSPGCAPGADAPIIEEIAMSDKTTKPGAPEATEALGAAAAASGNDAALKIVRKVADAGLPASFATQLLEQNLSVEEAYGRIIDEKAKAVDDGGEIRGHAPRSAIRADGIDRMKTGMELALLAKTGIAKGEQNEFTGMTLREMAREVLRARGVQVTGGVQALASAAFTSGPSMPGMAGGMNSTSDFGNILINIANKAMLKGFDEAQETFDQFTSVGTLTDFKPAKRVGLDAFPSLQKVEEGAEFQYGTMGDMGETVVLATYGRMFAITRQTLINDDLDAFSRLPLKMGRAARRTVGDLVFAILTGNPNMSDGNALFSAQHANLAGAGASPSEATVNAAITAMSTQKDRSKNAVALNIAPKFLIASPVNRSAVLQTLHSEYAPDDTAKAGTTKQPYAYNTVREAATAIFDARLTGNAWYMAADPAIFDTIEVSYLDGMATPFLEQQIGWTVDGTEFKVRLDAAATPLAWEGLYKNPGA